MCSVFDDMHIFYILMTVMTLPYMCMYGKVWYVDMSVEYIDYSYNVCMYIYTHTHIVHDMNRTYLYMCIV